MNDIPAVFRFESSEVRTIQRDGEPWFVAADICAAIDIANVTQAVQRLDIEDVTLCQIEGSHRPTNIVNESGLYSLILRSDKPEAKRFKKWVTAEVLPSIRKTGTYGIDPMQALNDPAAMRGLLLQYSEKVIERDKLIAEIAPKAQALDRLATNSIGSVCITNAAKDLQVQPKTLFTVLSGSMRWIYRRAGGSGWLAYQDKLQQGLLEHKVTVVTRGDGSEKLTEQVLITPKGLSKLARFFSIGQPQQIAASLI